MAYLEWSDKLSVNVREIDTQHKKLVDMINELHGSMRSQQGKDLQAKIINDMCSYAKVHFATEERYMQRTGYADFDAHKKEHEAFAVKALELQERMQRAGFVLKLEVLNFLKDWLQNHILGTDKKYSAHFNAKGIN